MCHEIISTVCNIPWRSSQRRKTYSTAEINCTLQNKSKSSLVYGCFKETIRRNPFRGEHMYHERKDWRHFFNLVRNFFYLRGVFHIAETTLWPNISTKSKRNSKILWPVYQGPSWIWITKKNWRSIFSWHTPFNQLRPCD